MKRFVIYPVLFVLSYVISRLAHVNGLIDFSQAIRPIIILSTLSILTLAVLSKILKDVHRAGFVFILFVFIMTFYGVIYNNAVALVGARTNVLSIFVLAALLGLFALSCRRSIWKLIRYHDLLTFYLNIVFGIMFLFQVIQAPLYKMVEQKGGDDNARFGNQPQVELSGDARPDIYILILDGYTRADVLMDIYKYDNSEFLSELEERGFFVANQAHSNYVQTQLSLSSLLNLNYISPPDPSDDLFSYYNAAITDNRAFTLLKQLGYKTISFDTGFTFSDIHNVDIYYDKFLPFNDVESYLLIDTPVETLSNVFGLGIPTYTYQAHRERVLYTFQQLQKVPELPASKIVFAHILSPHQPFVFDQKGNAVDPNVPYQLGNDLQGQKEYNYAGYRDQVIFVNNQVLLTVDAILAKSSKKPIILLMGDHGSGAMFKWSLQHPGCVWERTSNLEALLLPDYTPNSQLYSSISPINALRLVFNLYFNANLPLLEDKTFMTNESEPFTMKDITQQTESREFCTRPNPAP